MLQDIIKAGALGAEIVMSGKLPSERAKTWRFSQGYLKKTGDPAKVVDRAQSQAKTLPGVVGIEVRILPPNAHIHDRIDVNDELRAKIKMQGLKNEEIPKVEEKKTKKKKKEIK